MKNFIALLLLGILLQGCGKSIKPPAKPTASPLALHLGLPRWVSRRYDDRMLYICITDDCHTPVRLIASATVMDADLTAASEEAREAINEEVSEEGREEVSQEASEQENLVTALNARAAQITKSAGLSGVLRIEEEFAPYEYGETIGYLARVTVSEAPPAPEEPTAPIETATITKVPSGDNGDQAPPVASIAATDTPVPRPRPGGEARAKPSAGETPQGEQEEPEHAYIWVSTRDNRLYRLVSVAQSAADARIGLEDGIAALAARWQEAEKEEQAAAQDVPATPPQVPLQAPRETAP